jgi:hypothetical protein
MRKDHGEVAMAPEAMDCGARATSLAKGLANATELAPGLFTIPATFTVLRGFAVGSSARDMRKLTG